jgi:hypothetical protein
LCRLILALLHLAMIATAQAAQRTLATTPPSRPYLPTHGATALRFKEAYVTQPLIRKPIASGPPVVASGPEAAEVALANNQAAASTPPMPVATEPVPLAPEDGAPVEPEIHKVQPILPDDTRRKVQSQDFLPLFRFPGGSGTSPDVTVIPSVPTPPVPGTLPPSSATYRQQ